MIKIYIDRVDYREFSWSRWGDGRRMDETAVLPETSTGAPLKFYEAHAKVGTQ
jgi:hypothetical protein